MKSLKLGRLFSQGRDRLGGEVGNKTYPAGVNIIKSQSRLGKTLYPD